MSFLRSTSYSRLKRQLSGDLSYIVQMALHKSVTARYQSAQDLSEDISRYIAGMPMMAQKDNIWMRLSKLVSKKP